MRKKKKFNYTKSKLKHIKNFDFVFLVQVIPLDEMKKMKIINSNTFKEYLKKQIETDYEGGADNE